MDIAEELQIDVGAFVGKSTALLGITGSGKSNTAAVLVEEMLSAGLPLTIVDTDGEYYGLKEKYELLVAGRSEHAELVIGPENAASLAQISIERGISVILDLSEYSDEEIYEFLIEYFTSLWQSASKIKRPYQIVLEEAHEWIPQGVNSPLKQILTRIALRGRKRGLGIILASQRSAKVEKDVLTQTSLLFLHKVVHPTDMKVYNDLIPLSTKEVESIVGGLQPGQVVFISNHVPQVVQIRWRHTFHAGSTPEFGSVAQPELRQIDAALLKELQGMITSASKSSGKDDRRLEKRVKELEALLLEKEKEIARQAEQIALLSNLKVSGDFAMPETMQIDRAAINHLHIPQTAAPVHVIEAQAKVLPAKTNTVLLPPINESKIKSLRQRLSQLDSNQYRVFKLLVEHDTAMSAEDIAAWLNVTHRTAQRYVPPSALIKLGIVRCTKAGNAYIYRSTLMDYLTREFQGHDIEPIVQQLLSR